MAQTSAENAPSRHQRRWWRPYVHRVQKRYAVWLGVVMTVYTFLLIVLVVLAPVTSDPQGLLPASLSDRFFMAAQFLMWGETTWPAIITILIPFSIFLSFIATNRLGVPLERLERGLVEVQNGNLTQRFGARQGDDLLDAVNGLNDALNTIEQALIELRDHAAQERLALRHYLAEAGAQESPRGKELLEGVLSESEQIASVLGRFRLSGPLTQA